MAAERDLELLDDYLSNRMNAEGRAEFEEKLRKDPGLTSEYELQKQFIEGIRNKRIAELKTMLNNVPVPPASTGTAVATKVATWAVVAAIVGTVAYFYFSGNSGPETQPNTAIKEAEQQPIHDETSSDVTKTDDEEPVVSEEPAASEGKAVVIPKATKKSGASSGKPALDVYDPSKESSQADNDANGESLVKGTASSLAVEVNADTKRKFDYSLNNGKLTLYGPFEKNLYEVLEFFDGDKSTAFLYYRNQFYFLKETGEAPAALVQVKDAALIKKLNESRNK